MEEARGAIGLSRDFIIHPGETLSEVLEDSGMTQRDLAIRTGVTEKHVSTVINGKKNISATFARKLEYALGIEASFWMNLQAAYDRDLLEFEEMHNISEEEIAVARRLKEAVAVWAQWGWIKEGEDVPGRVLELRKILKVSNLCAIPGISYVAAYRKRCRNAHFDQYVMFAWQRMCEILTQGIEVAACLDIGKIKKKIPEIKRVMFTDASRIEEKLARLLAECGIAFKIVPGFSGAPVHGFVKKTDAGTVILCMTLRQKFADVFWFTLFHEIAHIINGDIGGEFIDFSSAQGDAEKEADATASRLLLEPSRYEKFVAEGKYKDSGAIAAFAKSQNVEEYIVEGRLMKEGRIPWSDRLRYEWVN